MNSKQKKPPHAPINDIDGRNYSQTCGVKYQSRLRTVRSDTTVDTEKSAISKLHDAHEAHDRKLHDSTHARTLLR
jgi:hypothetical protein